MTTDTDAPEADIGVPAGTPRRRPRLMPPRSAVPHLVLGLVFLAGYCAISIVRYTHFASMSWDTAIFVQEVRDYAHLQAPIVTIKGAGYNILGDHFSPILALLAPFYRVFPSPVTLLVAQAALFAGSVTIVSDTAAKLTTRAKGLCVGIAYGLSWGLQRAVDFDFHEIAFGVPLLALVLRNIVLKRWYPAAFWALPLVLVKEDMGLTVAAIGIVLVLLRQRMIGALLTVYGAAMLVITIYLVIPHFNPTGQYDYMSKLPGDSPTHELFTAPFGLLHSLFSPDVKLHTLGYLIAITGFLALRSPLVLIALPTLLWRFTSSNDAYWGMDWHYSAVLMPILFLALVDAIRRSEESGPWEWLRAYAGRAVVPAVTGIAAALCITMNLPASNVLSPSTYASSDRIAMLQQATAAVPDGVTVEANVTLMAHLAGRTQLYWVGGDKTSPPQYVALDMSYGWSPSAPTDVPGYVEGLHPGTVYQTVFDQQQFYVLKLVSG
ncbi:MULTISPECIES: DUF2079 domain-containing protein [Streptacidiphilus]|uniref:DUF2079 domain-containing protein n=1 Tax=Streptacidiphilus cavernicola TaxID=3342716 RepID=A0ABV6UFY4_9ACTN|nr:DUF2079 domain-containing protein [Streptacidiphilus jeojiense]